jgi:hypothetical protein
MALKFAVKTLEEVPEAFRGEYVQDAELGFKLAIEPNSGGAEDTAELRRAHEREKTERKALAKKLSDIETAQAVKDEETRVAKLELAKKSGDVDSLNKSWQEKFDAAQAAKDFEYKPALASMEADLTREMVDRHATSLAASIALPGSEDVLFPHIQRRLRIETRDGKRTTVVVDKEGKASAMTIEDLKKEFMADMRFAPLLVGSRASGGGSGGGKGGGATPGNKPRSKMSTREKSDYISEHGRQEYEKLPMD